MARGGINKALVQKARQAILARGERPSIDAVRIELGNTGSKTTIHRYLKELEAAEHGRVAAPALLSEQLANLVAQLAAQLQDEARAAVAQEREQLVRERRGYHDQIHQLESRSQQLETSCAGLTEQLQVAHQGLQKEQQLRQLAEVEVARLQQAERDQAVRLQDREGQIRSLEEKHQHARDALEHYRQASKEQREQEQRRHETQVQQLQLELRQLQQTLIVKQDELTQLNRDNARLLAEARQVQKEQHAQQQFLAQKTQALETARSALTDVERTNEALEQRCRILQGELAQLGEAATFQAQQTQSLQERLIEATAQLKLLGHAPLRDGGGGTPDA
ncbi:DNA-binding protein [Pseudomonas aeruginosa]|uniref:DNA-binding protein n=1 Tax=Pseudomonas aeruginosa TaxID=287 RepID=UPI001C949CA0|nr:DNA-binding protein [Pseudomonas aeruginosa]HBO1414555.1 DNA-binding protein [Pseudomonas aeruginosa]HBO3807440.1 DNA-binding protein [Pseudomonas aeruginosa]HBO7425091.1 cointegrate resolution protein T [Pseudomonas aeruginosa]HCL3529982.1 DNA-binding protein [Pseudomonas aeruginosa]